MSLSKPELQRNYLRACYKAKENEVKYKKGEDHELVYENQKAAALEICLELFDRGKTVVTLIAEPQVGKTGTFLETAFLACTHPNDTHIVDPGKVFIITGMSDTDWQKQTKNDMLEPFRNRVYHRGRLNTQDRQDGFYTNLADAKDSLLIFDECHIANGKEHQISGMLRDLGLLDLSVLKARNIKILDVSATPGATLNDTLAWGEENHSVVILKSSEAYTGFRHFIQENRLHASYDLTNEKELENLITFVRSTFPEPLWHVIRLPSKSRKNSDLVSKILRVCAREGWHAESHSSVDRIDDLDYHMGIRPKTHRFLLIKEFWRAGKRLDDTYFGIAHDAPTTDVNVAAQGLAGRLCGNDKKRGPGSPHVFTNVELIKQYIAWIDAKGDFSKVKEYTSAQLSVKNGRITKSRKTFAHESNVALGKEPETTIENHDVDLDTFLVYTDENIVKDVCRLLGYNYMSVSPKTTGPNKGFRETSLNAAATKVSLIDAIKKVPGAYGTNKGLVTWRTCLPCYKDINDSTSLHFVVILRPMTDVGKIRHVKAVYPSIVVPKRGAF
jgi:hypothetical protein